MFLKLSQNSQENTCAWVSFLIKLQASGIRPATLLKKRLWHRCYPMNFATSLRTPFLTEHLRWLPLSEYVQSTHRPVLILQAAKKTCHLLRNICDNIAAVTNKICRLAMIHTKFEGEVCFSIFTIAAAMFLSCWKHFIIFVKTAG